MKVLVNYKFLTVLDSLAFPVWRRASDYLFNSRAWQNLAVSKRSGMSTYSRVMCMRLVDTPTTGQ